MVTYESLPDPGFWASLPGEIDLFVIVDNSTTPAVQEEVQARCRTSPVPCLLIQNRTNLGLARALNSGVIAAKSRGCETVYFLDQDAIVDTGFFRAERTMLEQLELNGGGSVGLVAPIVTDLEPSLSTPSLVASWTPVSSIINSGALLRIPTFEAIGGFNEALFVEGVDHDFAARMRASGRTLVRANRIIIRQPFGHALTATSLGASILERLYAASYYLSLLSGRSNSLHTRLPSYSLARREELARSLRHRGTSGRPVTRIQRVTDWLALLGTLTIDSVVSGNREYLRLAFREQ